VRRTALIREVGNGHWEATRSAAAREYVWKEATRVSGTQFEMGELPVRRNDAKDWEAIRESAKNGELVIDHLNEGFHSSRHLRTAL
jgi:hypothetical protein